MIIKLILKTLKMDFPLTHKWKTQKKKALLHMPKA